MRGNERRLTFLFEKKLPQRLGKLKNSFYLCKVIKRDDKKLPAAALSGISSHYC